MAGLPAVANTVAPAHAHLDHRGQTHTTGGSMYQHAVAGLQLRQMVQRILGRGKSDGQGGRLGESQMRGDARDQCGVGYGIGAEAVGSHGHDRIAHGHVRHVGSHGKDGAGALLPKPAGVVRIHAQRVEHIPKIQPRSLHANDDLTGAGLRLLHRL